MGLLTDATNEQAFLKAGLFGGAGSGKTTTSAYLAMAISKRLGDGKPVAFFETEAGSDFLVERFKAEGIQLLRKKSHALADLLEVAKEAEQSCSVLIVDSISHIWAEVCEAKLRAVNAARKKKNLYATDKLEFQHWGDVKREWQRWTTAYLNTRLHVIVCGRAGNIWEYEVNEETGKKELQKGGTKMKAENEFGYEPSLLIEMERVAKGNAPGSGWKHRAHVLKDRSDTINGMKFDFERGKKGYSAGDWKVTFKPFEPVFKSLNIGGIHKTIDETASSESLFPGAEGESRSEQWSKRRTIACEEIQGVLSTLWPGMDAVSKRIKAAILDALFATRSWTAVESKSVEELEPKVKLLRLFEMEAKGREFVDEAEVLTLLNKCACAEQVQSNGKAAVVTADELPGEGHEQN